MHDARYIMKRVTKREKIMIGAAVFAVIFGCFYVFVYQPKEKELLRLQEEIRTVDLGIEEIATAVPGLKKLEEDVAREQKRVSSARKMTSNTQAMEELLGQLAGAAHRLDMEVISLGEEWELQHKNSSYSILTTMMDIQCPYRHLGSYLQGLSDLPGLFTVDRLEILRDRQIFPKVQVKLTLSILVTVQGLRVSEG
jgi:Tfp pilus assembly protein PilO